ncbi:uncharacterized protein EAF01_004697 [Botrytis porri]|uniref:uncharacterized protein n=1 Tax=Botrytis porri TaxID=87229 RepID=UPI0018FF55B8|nr:uncharacterized protein EAF01_004697 [Botrytis porri]KAF7907110.1 hypothetical protein EAF01_004697 [Botrytis porri]
MKRRTLILFLERYCVGVWGSIAKTSLDVGDYFPDPEDPFAVPKTVDSTKRLNPESDPASIGPWISRNMTAASNPWRRQAHVVAVCSLQPCIRTFKANINGTRLTEHWISSSSTILWGFSSESHSSGKDWIGMIDIYFVSKGERQVLSEQSYEIDSSSQWLAYNRSFMQSQAKYDLVSSLLSHRCLYLMAGMIMRGIPFISDLLGDNLQGYVSSLDWSVGIEEGINRTSAFYGLFGPRMMLDLHSYSLDTNAWEQYFFRSCCWEHPTLCNMFARSVAVDSISSNPGSPFTDLPRGSDDRYK